MGWGCLTVPGLSPPAGLHLFMGWNPPGEQGMDPARLASHGEGQHHHHAGGNTQPTYPSTHTYNFPFQSRSNPAAPT